MAEQNKQAAFSSGSASAAGSVAAASTGLAQSIPDVRHWPHPNLSTWGRPPLNIVLYQPEIPANTGNISRTCVVTGAALHLIEPLGFDISERAVRRAGLDYWQKLQLYTYRDWADFLARNPGAEIFLATTKGSVPYTEIRYPRGAFLVFGRETAGLPEELHQAYPGRRLRIPMRSEYRSLNLSNAVAVVLFEALRQQGFPDLL